MFIIAGRVEGYEHLWLFGDEFGFRTGHQNFAKNRNTDGTYNSYTFSHFEVKEIWTSKYKSNDSNVIRRLINAVIACLNDQKRLPKVMVFVLDDDVLRGAKEKGCNYPEYYPILVKALFRNIERAVDSFKESLPIKSKRHNVPHLLWIVPPTHKYFHDTCNDDRSTFAAILQEEVQLHRNMSVLKMIKHWSHEEGNFFIQDSYRFTTEGLMAYWQAVDSAIRFWNIALAKKFEKIKPKSNTAGAMKHFSTNKY